MFSLSRCNYINSISKLQKATYFKYLVNTVFLKKPAYSNMSKNIIFAIVPRLEMSIGTSFFLKISPINNIFPLLKYIFFE